VRTRVTASQHLHARQSAAKLAALGEQGDGSGDGDGSGSGDTTEP